METGDGWLVRLRVKGGVLSATIARAIAELSVQHGNGHIDLTARGNLQIRGVTSAGHDPLLRALSDLGLADSDGFAVQTNPLAGIDPACDAQAPRIAAALEEALAAAPFARMLPDKFACIVDGGGLLPLNAVQADLRIDTIAIGQADMNQIVSDALCLAHDFARLAERGLSIRQLRAQLPGTPSRYDSGGILPLGLIPLGSTYLVGIGLPFGRIEQQALTATAELAERFGDGTLRLSPGRVIFIPSISADHAADVLLAATAAGLITDPQDPLRSIQACPGAPACSSGVAETRQLARSIADALPQLGKSGRTVHVSGCAKGCAYPRRANATITATGHGYDLAFNARAGETPSLVACASEEILNALWAWHHSA